MPVQQQCRVVEMARINPATIESNANYANIDA